MCYKQKCKVVSLNLAHPVCGGSCARINIVIWYGTSGEDYRAYKCVSQNACISAIAIQTMGKKESKEIKKDSRNSRGWEGHRGLSNQMQYGCNTGLFVSPPDGATTWLRTAISSDKLFIRWIAAHYESRRPIVIDMMICNEVIQWNEKKTLL